MDVPNGFSWLSFGVTSGDKLPWMGAGTSIYFTFLSLSWRNVVCFCVAQESKIG